MLKLTMEQRHYDPFSVHRTETILRFFLTLHNTIAHVVNIILNVEFNILENLEHFAILFRLTVFLSARV